MIECSVLVMDFCERGSAHNDGCGHKGREPPASEQALDETTIQVLKEDGRAATAKSFMWVRRGGAPGQTIILFDYAPSRAGAIPMRLIDEYRGYLQSDAYSGYNAPARRDGVIHVGCLDHARRKFVEAVKAQHAVAGHERGLAPEALLIIRKIYAVEKLARDAKMSAEQRHKLRTEKAQPIWDELPPGSTET